MIYNNKRTGTFAEFTIDGLFDFESLENDEIIDKFLNEIIKKLDDTRGVFLPKSMMKLLSDADLDIFLFSTFDDRISKEIRESLFVVQENKSVVNEYGVEYRVEYVGINKTIVSYDKEPGRLSVFNIPTKSFSGDSVVSTVDFMEEIF